MADCINLSEKYGDRFKITFDECYDPGGRPRDKLDPWYMQIPCERGAIYPYGGPFLAIEVDGRPVTANRVKQLKSVITIQEGTYEFTFKINCRHFEDIVDIIKPLRRKRVSQEERARLAEIGKLTQFLKR